LRNAIFHGEVAEQRRLGLLWSTHRAGLAVEVGPTYPRRRLHQRRCRRLFQRPVRRCAAKWSRIAATSADVMGRTVRRARRTPNPLAVRALRGHGRTRRRDGGTLGRPHHALTIAACRPPCGPRASSPWRPSPTSPSPSGRRSNGSSSRASATWALSIGGRMSRSSARHFRMCSQRSVGPSCVKTR